MFGIKNQLMVVLLLSAIGIGYAGYQYVINMQETIKFQAALIATQESALKNTNATLDQLKADIVRQTELTGELNVKLKQAETYSKELRSKLIRHDLEALAIAKPGLIEKRMNDATKKVFDDLELITGSD